MKRRKFLKATGTSVAAVGMGILPVGGAQQRSASPAVAVQSEGPASQQVKVKMRDGVELVGDLYLPGGGGPFPIMMTKSPYPPDRHIQNGKFYSSKGYGVLIVSQRGRFGSGGIFHQSRNEGWLEHKDGYDAIEWAATQPWSTGKIGTFGISSDGQWQLSAAPTQPPHLRAMFCSYAAHHRDGGRMEHCVHASTGPTWHHNNDAMGRPLRRRDDWNRWLAFWKESQLPMLMTLLHPELIEQFQHTAYDNYWRDVDPATRYADFNVPVYHESGWYDRYVRATFGNFNGIRTHAKSQETRDAQKVIMGPWLHGGGVAPETEAVKFAPQAKIDRHALHLRWFDYWLKGIDTGVLRDPAVRVYLMGAERWLESNTWPLPGIQYVKYYLRRGPAESTKSINDGRLQREAPRAETADEYLHDPYNPVPTIGSHGGFGGIWEPGPRDQREIEPHLLTYTTDALEKDVEVVGEVKVRFFASTSARDADFILTLTDVFPGGNSALLRQNVVQVRFRDSEEKESPVTPGKVYELTLLMDGIANLFKAGHRIRLSIASSSFPAFFPNPGTGGPLHLVTKAVTARNAIYHESRYPSAIEIPVREGAA